MALNSTEEIIEDLRQGKIVIIMDDEDRENEGDLLMAADWDTPLPRRRARMLARVPLMGTVNACRLAGACVAAVFKKFQKKLTYFATGLHRVSQGLSWSIGP